MINIYIVIYIDCPEGYWGRNCSHTCDCLNDGICDQFSGACKCSKGYIGEKCESECPDGNFFGLNCSEPCQCKNQGKCHHISGECQCAPGK